MGKHLAALGFERVNAYLVWCKKNGYAASLEKSLDQLSAELSSFAATKKLSRAKAIAKLSRHPLRAIEAACRGELCAEETRNPKLQLLCEAIQADDVSTEIRAELPRLLATLGRKPRFLLDSVAFGDHSYPYLKAVIILLDHRARWLRSMETWKPTSHNKRKQFAELVRHLLVKFDVPLFMDAVWFNKEQNKRPYQEWFIRLGLGGNIRNEATPIQLTKKMAHFFMQAPSNFTVEQALRWGQVRGLGGDPRLANAVVASRIGSAFANEEFWISVLRFFVDHPMLDKIHVGPIIDYLHHQRFESRQEFTAPGVREQLPPQQPNLSMKGRTPDSLLKQVERWHVQLGKIRSPEKQWQSSGIKPFEMRSGIANKNLRIWRIHELLSTAELVDEGRKMRHCVATYARSCANGTSSIWSMSTEDFAGVEKRQTIELNCHRIIVQCRGKCNQPPNAQEMEVLARWATEARIEVSPWVRKG